MTKWYCTFGYGQPHFGCYVVIGAPNALAATQIMTALFGSQWANVYESLEAAGVSEWHLKEMQ